MPSKKKDAARNIKPTLGSVRNIKLTLEYDGTGFFGFQSQASGVPTIQQALEKALAELFQKKVPLISASSRTDAGVHAEDQVVHFKTESDISPFRILRALNHFLPGAVSVIRAEEVPSDFHARFHPVSKIYEYRIWNDSSRPAIWRNFAHHEPVELHLADMKKAAKYFIGKHDFRAFTSPDRVIKGRAVAAEKISFVRHVKRLQIRRQGKMVLFTIEADGFLYHMVRNMIGTLAAVGKGKLKPESVMSILRSGDRKLAAETLPAQGLTLKQVRYPRLSQGKTEAKAPRKKKS